MSKFMSLSSFADLYDVNINNVMVQISISKINRSIVRRPLKGTLEIDCSFFEKRIEFKRTVWDMNHKFYYFFSQSFQAYQLSEILQKMNPETSAVTWNSFIGNGLFSSLPESVFRYKVSSLHWKFFRSMRVLWRRLLKASGKRLDSDIDVVMERLADRC